MTKGLDPTLKDLVFQYLYVMTRIKKNKNGSVRYKSNVMEFQKQGIFKSKVIQEGFMDEILFDLSFEGYIHTGEDTQERRLK